MENPKHVCVVVLGDIGRSPRMQYHALSLAQKGNVVDVIGYGNTQPVEELKREPLVLYHYMLDYPNLPLPRFINYIAKTIWQVLTLMFVLLMLKRPDVLIVQNPPAIPSLFVCWFYCLVRRTKFIIDWHNYAYTIMALSTSEKSILVKITKYVEQFIGRRARVNFCVTNAMKNDLKNQWSIDAVTLYDRPPLIFTPRSLEEKHNLFEKLSLTYKEFAAREPSRATAFTIRSDAEIGGLSLKSDRPGLLVSSTSWTEDEDFSVLLMALQEYENHRKDGNNRNLPKLVCVITGKGPLKEYYCDKIRSLNWESVSIVTPWLESGDYPILLASADLGVCLHTSSSGLDLPMKVVDMFGCGLPVCAYEFKCLNELVRHEVNSFVFDSPEDLSKHLLDWFDNFTNNASQKEVEKKFKTELQTFQNLRWKENWDQIAAPHF